MFFNKVYFFIILIFVSVGAFFYAYSNLQDEYRLTNSHGAAQTSVNLLDLHSDYFLDALTTKFTSSDLYGLPIVDLYMPEKSQSTLQSNIPINIKKWVPAYFRYPNGEYKDVKARYRGDNLFNWSYQRKSYRVKLKKKNLINAKRVLNYTPLSKADTLTRYLPYFLGKQINLPTPDARLVEFRLNGITHGVYLEYASIDEGFLRRNNFMPVNIYKGEQFHTGRDQFKGVELFNNPALWEKSAIFNQRETENFDDIRAMISLIPASKSSEKKLSELSFIADTVEWAKFDAFQTLLQSWHNDDEHNMRLISDVWKGKMLPIVYEVISNIDPNQELVFENPPHSLFKRFNESSQFLYFKYKALYSMLNQKLLSSASSHIISLEDLFQNSISRDVFRGRSIDVRGNNNQSSIMTWSQYAANLEKRERHLLDILSLSPDSSWVFKNNTLSLSTSGVVPLHQPSFKLQDNSASTKPNIYFDKDGNGKISEQDILIPSYISQNRLTIDATFFSNRVSFKNSYSDYPKTIATNTVFNLIIDNELKISDGASIQFFTQIFKPLQMKNITGQSPHLLNNPVFPQASQTEVWQGLKYFKKTNIFHNKVKILPGTKIFLADGASIIFKNEVTAIGLKEAEIDFISDDNSIWGTVALVGPKTRNSVFKYVNMSGGSGYDAPNLRMVGMFSVHDTSNIHLSNMNFTNNYIYDDLIHIVYSKNVILKNSNIQHSLFDAIDIDISEVIIENCLIESSGNDGIDSMSSIVKIKNTEIIGSIDKGISIGEKSNVLIIGSTIAQNNIGIESKDKSIANVYNSKISNNSLDINAYKKNWQYGGGGVVNILNQQQLNPNQTAQNDKNSKINFFQDAGNREYLDSLPLDVFKIWDENIFGFKPESAL